MKFLKASTYAYCSILNLYFNLKKNLYEDDIMDQNLSFPKLERKSI